MAEPSASVRAFYDGPGWQRAAGGVSVDAMLFEDLRPVAAEYVRACRRKLLPFLPGGDVLLDAASGPVQYPEYREYSARYRTHLCVDFSCAALRQARAHLLEKGQYVGANVLALPFPDNIADTTISLHTIYHVDPAQQERAVRELVRVTRPGKPVVIVYANPDRLLSRLARVVRGVRTDPAPRFLYHAHPLRWWRRFADDCDVRLLPWRSVTARDARALIPESRVGRTAFAALLRFERVCPSAALWGGAYPLVVLRKRTAAAH